jgi:hypothetical protein
MSLYLFPFAAQACKGPPNWSQSEEELEHKYHASSVSQRIYGLHVTMIIPMGQIEKSLQC